MGGFIMIKAYAWHNDDTGFDDIVWCETAGKAKYYIACKEGIPFTDVKVYRVKWADKFKCIEDIKIKDFFDNGWGYVCSKCGEITFEDEATFINDNEIICSKCKGDN
jgi:formylmethanofuran dehydrogenase subunit E